MTGRLYKSLTFRTSFALRDWISRRCRRQVLPLLPTSKTPDNRPHAAFTLLMFVGRQQIDMMRVSLSSILRTWTSLPTLQLTSDGTIDAGDLQQAGDFWPTAVTAQSWTVATKSHSDRGRTRIAALAEKNMMGRKLAAVLAAADHGPTLYADSDVLWFHEPSLLPTAPRETVCKMAQDLRCSYDLRMLENIGAMNLAREPYLNAGVCFANGDLYESAALDPLLDYANRHPDYFSEQTIMAYATHRLGGHCWAKDEIILRTDDQLRLGTAPSYMQSAFARHYVGDVRHWFWRDALRLLQQHSVHS